MKRQNGQPAGSPNLKGIEMSLYSHDEVCETCKFAEFHSCCGQFCYCKEGHEEDMSALLGTCEFKEERNKG